MRYLTNTATTNPAALTAQVVLQLGALDLVLRLIDGAANYYMADMGHVMGVYVETDMRRDAFARLQAGPYLLFQHQGGPDHGPHHQRPVRCDRVRPPLPQEFFIAAIKITASFVILCESSVALTLILFGLRAPDGRGVHLDDLKARAAFRRPAGADRRAECRI